MPEPVDRYTWRLAIVGEQGPSNATRRHVLLTLSLSMSSAGDSAWPSQTTLAKRCLVTRRTIVTHLELAERTGWLVREPGPRGGKGWRLTSYAAVVPDHVYDSLPERPWEEDPMWSRGKRPSPRYARVERPDRDGGERDAWKVVNVERDGGETGAYGGEPNATVTLPLNSSSVTSPKRERALARTPASDKSDSKTKRKTKTEEPAHISTVLADQGVANEEVLKVKTEIPAPPPRPPMRSPQEQIAELRRLIAAQPKNGDAA